MPKLKLSYKPFTLELKHTFTVSVFSRTVTPIVLTEVEYDGLIGYGEASMPAYLGETQETIMEFLSKVDLSKYNDVFNLENILKDIDLIENGNTAAKASIDIALHDLAGKMLNKPWYEIWGMDLRNIPYTSFTIGIDDKGMIEKKVKEAEDFKILKVKLGRDNDRDIIHTIREITDVPLIVDINQGWKDKVLALEMIYWLKERKVILVEQPLPKESIDETVWLTEKSPLPVIADESVQRLPDIIKIKDAFSGINIKLMKCTGMHEAYKMIKLAKELNLKIMLGCMTETSCGISAASHLSPLADWVDLDGAFLIKNDVFKGAELINGKIFPAEFPGIGVKKIYKN
jgi:L-alanine-DL-glutamate epimerase-like enolase superfamily enzyme